MYVDVPSDINKRIHGQDGRLTDRLRALEVKSQRFIKLQQSKSSQALRVLINSERIGEVEDPAEKAEVAASVTKMLNGLSVWADDEQKDPNLQVHMYGPSSPEDTILPVEAKVLWPAGPLRAIAFVAMNSMVDIAQQLDNSYQNGTQRKNLFLSTIDPNRFSLCVDSAYHREWARQDIVTDNSGIDIDAPKIVEAHVVDARTSIDQLVGLAGLIAVANAPKISPLLK